MDPKTRKTEDEHKALHSRYDVDILYLPRKEGRGFDSIQCINTTTRRLQKKIAEKD